MLTLYAGLDINASFFKERLKKKCCVENQSYILKNVVRCDFSVPPKEGSGLSETHEHR